jgi:hypothetical protein
LAVVFRVAIRLKIVAELYIRPMSPKDFFEEFGGGSVERVAQHFEALEETGWLRQVGPKEQGGKLGGHPETLFRATDTPFFDAETWTLLPYSLRLAYSWSTFKATAKELREGIERAFDEERPSRDLTCTPLELDEYGWTRVIAKLDAHFESTFEEQEDAKIRVERSGGDLFRAGILQAGFESPRSDDRLALCLADGPLESTTPFPQRMAPIFADDLSMQILEQLNKGDLTINQFFREFAGDATIWAVRHRFRRLKDLAWIAVVKKIKRRAAREYVYRATKPAIVNNGLWTDVPEALGRTATWKTFVDCSDLVKEAIAAGTFDMRDDRHLSWSIVNLDRKGWHNEIAAIEDLANFIREEEKRAEDRIEDGAKPLTMVVGLAVVESPVGPFKAP